MTATKPIEYKDSTFYCDVCSKLKRGTGFFIPTKNKAYCKDHYPQVIQEEFKK